MYHFVLVFFSPFSIAITSFGEERANLSAFRTFVRFVFVWICRLGSWKGVMITHRETFGQIKIPMMFSIKLNLKTLRLLQCLHMIFLHCILTLPHHLIKYKLIDIINQTFIPENTRYLACNKECAFFTSDVYRNYNLWYCQVCGALVYLLDNILLDL